MNKLHKSALWYARHGWYVMPLHEPIETGCSCEQWKRENKDPDYICRTSGKHPRHNAWEEVATIDEVQINKWWRAWPTANIGIAAGKSGLVCLDVDTYKEYGDVVTFDTTTSLTGGGGEHAIFAHPNSDIKLGNSKQGLPHYIDVRSWGGMFVAPPSVHPSGNAYEWESGHGPHERLPAALPDDILQRLIKAAQESATVTPFGDLPEVDMNKYSNKMPALVLALMAGDRSKIDFWLIRSLIRAGMSQDEIGALWHTYDPTGKFSDKNGQGKKYLAHTIAQAKAHIEKVNKQHYQVQEEAA